MSVALLTALAFAAASPVASEAPLSERDALAVFRSEPLSVDARTLHRAASALKRDDQRDVDLVLREARFRYDDVGGRVLTSRVVYWLNTAAGVRDWGSVFASWRPGIDARPEVRVRVIDGVLEHPLDPTTLTQAPAESDGDGTYDDRQELRGPLPAARPGVLVEEVVVSRELSPPFRHGRLDRYWFEPSHEARRFAVVVDHPRTLPVRFRLRGLDGQRTKQVTKERVALRIEGEGPQRSQWMPMLPPWAAQGTYVAVSTGASWNGVARGYSDIVDGVLEKSARLSDIAGAMAPAGVGRDELVRRVLEQQHDDVRCASLVFGDGSIVPRTPEQTLERRYGDCKDKATLLVGVLRARGFRAHVALLRAWETDDVLPRMPGIGMFNHAIVYLPADPERGLAERWVDATEPSVPFGELPEGDQGRLALVAASGSTDLVRLPRTPATANRLVREVRIELAPSGHGRVVERTSATGTLAHHVRRGHVGERPKAIEKALVAQVRSRYALLDDKALAKEKNTPEYPRALAKDVRVRSAKGLGDRSPVEVEIEIPRAGVSFSSSDEAEVWLSAGLLLQHVPYSLKHAPSEDADAPERKLPFHLTRAKTVIVRHHVIPPKGYTMDAPPPAFALDAGGVHLHRKLTLAEDGSLRGESVLLLEPSQLTLAEVKKLRAGFTRFAESEEVLAMFRSDPARFLDKGDARAALEAWRARIAAAPKEASGYIGYVDALGALGFVEEARRVARRGTERAPKSTDMWLRYAWAHTLGTHGGDFAEGWDPKGAERGYRQALALSPALHGLRPSLARAIAIERSGRFTTDAARLKRALEVLKPFEAEGVNEGTIEDERVLRTALLTLMSRHAEVLAIEEKAASDEEQALRVVAEAIVNGSDAAALSLSRYSSDNEARARVVEAAVADLLRAGAFTQAAALLRATARHAQNPAASLQRATALESAATVTLPAWDSDAQSFGKRLFSAVVGPEREVDEVLSRLHPSVVGKDRKKFLASYERVRGRLGQGSEALQRFVIANLTVTAQGDEETGWLLRARGPGITPDKTAVVIVRDPRDQRYRVAEVQAFRAATLGALALEHLERGQLERARTVLLWHDEALASAPEARRKWLAAADEHGLRVSAAWLLAGPTEPAHLPALRSTMEQLLAAAVPEDDEALRLLERRTLSLLVLLLARDNAPKHRASIERLLQAAAARATSDEDRAAYQMLCAMVYRRLGRWDDALAAQKAAHALDPAPAMQRLIANIAFEAGRMDEALALTRELLDKHPDDLDGKNELAWFALYDDRVPLEEALRLAQEAAASTNYKRAAYLHTLAAVLIESGRELDGLSLVRQIERMEGDAYDDNNALLWGRVAQRLGLDEEARRIYATLEDDDGSTQLSRLVERWTKKKRRKRR